MKRRRREIKKKKGKKRGQKKKRNAPWTVRFAWWTRWRGRRKKRGRKNRIDVGDAEKRGRKKRDSGGRGGQKKKKERHTVYCVERGRWWSGERRKKRGDGLHKNTGYEMQNQHTLMRGCVSRTSGWKIDTIGHESWSDSLRFLVLCLLVNFTLCFSEWVPDVWKRRSRSHSYRFVYSYGI